ncbi:major facilitator superfamily domain-containing protein [Exophiala viscosa]|uniref:major facilitator superfamily domain-containing protein n=1 Tax=Exophiala viscosa TaxID=2486360 RepID=UPI00219180C4|nr:major facilitator superfamily domain-containing protein [Exophiala viscosa]
MVKEAKRAPQLPKQQLLILAVCRFAEPVAMTSVYPYIPEMIQSFNVRDDKVAKWAGLMSGVFSLSQCLTGIAWGRASDRFGRKPIILLALTCTMISSVLFGFSKSLVWAFIARSMQGLSNGNVGIIRTAVAELVPQKELQPRAFSVMPLVWNIGSIFGPSFGGSLVHPVERYPHLFGRLKLLEKFPFALPNMLISVLFLLGITSGFLFLHETLEEKKSSPDYGLMLGKLLAAPCTRQRRRRRTWSTNEEEDPFLSGTSSEMSSPVSKPGTNVPPKQPRWADVFSRQSNINLLVYTFLAMHSVAYDQLLPIFMHYPVQSSKDPQVHLPWKFAGGFGIDSNRIGLLFTIYGVFGMLIQFFVFPTFARRYGVLNCLKACVLTFPFVYLATPFTALLPTDGSRQGVMIGLMLVKGFCGIFAFPCSTILLTNSAASLKVLGTLNGVATSISAIGRAAGPALAGATFTAGVDIGYVVISWWTLAVVGIVGAVPVWSLVEMEGFGGGEDEDDDDEDDEIDDVVFGDPADPNSKSSALQTGGTHARKASAATASFEDVFDDESPSESRQLTPATSRGSRDPSRRASLQLSRVASPIGLGPGVVPPGARRYSSDLGATRSGLGPGGTSYY